MFHHGLWMFAATSCPNLDSACICWKRASETIIPQRERRCENMIEDACLLNARKQLCSSRAQGSENKCQQKGNNKWQQDMDPVSLPAWTAWMFKVIQDIQGLLFHAISTLSARKTLRSAATLFTQAQHQLAQWHTMTQRHTTRQY